MYFYDSTGRISYFFDPKKPWEEQTPMELPPLSDEGMWAAISWSPDGRWLAGHGQAVPGLFGEIVIYSLETEQYRSLYPSGVVPLWLHDSRGLLFSSEAGAIHKVDIDSGKSSEVLSLVPDSVLPTDFSPDHKWLYFTRMKTEADIWILTLSEPR
jgi:Tol biopolymer transport system component